MLAVGWQHEKRQDRAKYGIEQVEVTVAADSRTKARALMLIMRWCRRDCNLGNSMKWGTQRRSGGPGFSYFARLSFTNAQAPGFIIAFIIGRRPLTASSGRQMADRQPKGPLVMAQLNTGRSSLWSPASGTSDQASTSAA